MIALTAAPLIIRTLGGGGQAPLLEALSRGMLGLIGVWFLVRAFKKREKPYREGIMVGVVAGLAPCPLTLFAMFLALSRGVPEAGLTFALSMFLGVGLTLAAVAGLVVAARTWFVTKVARHGASTALLSRGLEGLTGRCSWSSASRRYGPEPVRKSLGDQATVSTSRREARTLSNCGKQLLPTGSMRKHRHMQGWA
ncbi:MAG: transporter permease [Microvirga sp.]|jgi:ABC-type nickel/cobalt efflux system permease component RcnA|nr:transporter permease [Microvirga sp.]